MAANVILEAASSQSGVSSAVTNKSIPEGLTSGKAASNAVRFTRDRQPLALSSAESLLLGTILPEDNMCFRALVPFPFKA